MSDDEKEYKVITLKDASEKLKQEFQRKLENNEFELLAVPFGDMDIEIDYDVLQKQLKNDKNPYRKKILKEIREKINDEC